MTEITLKFSGAEIHGVTLNGTLDIKVPNDVTGDDRVQALKDFAEALTPEQREWVASHLTEDQRELIRIIIGHF